MSVKTSDEKIQAIRNLRSKGYSIAFICNALHTNIFVVNKYTKDIKIDLRRKPQTIEPSKDLYPCNTYKFTDLPEKVQQYYLSLKPPNKDEDKKTYITSRKGEYGKAVIFEDYRANFGV